MTKRKRTHDRTRNARAVYLRSLSVTEVGVKSAARGSRACL